MISIFTIPRGFDSEAADRQRNAIGSWLALGPGVEVILCGDDPGVADYAAGHGLRHLPALRRSPQGTPLLNDAFAQAAAAARHDRLCYANCDLVFLPDFPEAVAAADQLLGPGYAVGQCTDLQLQPGLNFADAGAVAELIVRVAAQGHRRPPEYVDYFAFARALAPAMPDFAVGRAGWDNWLLWDARRRGLPVVDLSDAALVVHQHHGYGHLDGGKQEAYAGAEAQRNYALMGGPERFYTIRNASHRLLSSGRVVRNWQHGPRMAARRLRLLLKRGWWRLLAVTRPLRHPLGLRRRPPTDGTDT